MDALTFKLPWPPSINHYYRHTRNGIFISSKGQLFRKRVVALLGAREPLTGPLSLTLELYPPDRRKRDADNSLKSVQDALQHANLYVDDCQIHQLHVYKCTPKPPTGEILITIAPTSSEVSESSPSKSASTSSEATSGV